MTATFFFLVPMIYLSGFIFPIENMPRVIQWVTTLIPLRYFLVIVRGIFLKGVGLDVLWPQFAALAIWGVSVLSLAALRSQQASVGIEGGFPQDRRPRSQRQPHDPMTHSVEEHCPMRVHVGTSGYNYPEWRGHVLSGGPARQARCSATTPSGSAPSRSTTRSTGCRRRRRPTAGASRRRRGSRYTLKAPQQITHDQRLKDSEDTLQVLLRGGARLGPHLATLLFQLPPTFKCDSRGSRRSWRAARRHAAGLRVPARLLAERRRLSRFCAAQARRSASRTSATRRRRCEPPRATATSACATRATRRRISSAGPTPSIAQRRRWDDVFVYFKHEDEGKGPEFARGVHRDR